MVVRECIRSGVIITEILHLAVMLKDMVKGCIRNNMVITV